MTLRRLALEHFKCFRSLDLPLAPLTVLTGFNAAGKSTTLQSLLLLAQALRRAPSAAVLALNGPLVRLGTAGEVASYTTAGEIKFEVESNDATATWRFGGTRGYGGRYFEIFETEVKTVEGLKRSKLLWPRGSRYAKSELLSKIRDLIFLGAARLAQAEAFPDPQDAQLVHADVGCDGEYAPWWYVQLADEEVQEERRHPTEERLTVRGQIDAYLSELFPESSANAETIARTSLTRLDLKVGRSSDWRRPSNIGYGISYAFPVLVALVIAKPGQLIIIDSPEAHLHPKAQSVMGRILARFAAQGLQLLVETHSDHVISGIRLCVKQREIAPNDVAFHFFKAVDGNIDIATPRVDIEGNLEFWPAGFFDQAESDLAILSGLKL